MNPDSGELTLLKNLSTLTLEEDPDADKIQNLISLPVSATDGYNCEADQQNTNRTTLKLKVFTNFEPKFLVKNQRVIFDETLSPNDPLPEFQLDEAIDDNNLDPPADVSWEDQKICYYIVNATKAVSDHFAIDKETNNLIVTSPLDVDNCVSISDIGCSTYYIYVLSTNNCNNKPEEYDLESVLDVEVTVNDLNDNSPRFIDLRSYYVYSTIQGECRDCIIQATDDDIGMFNL